MPFGVSDDDQRKWIVKNRDEVQRHVEGDLIAYGVGFPTKSYGSMAMTKGVSALGGLVMSRVGKKQAGGLPQNFVVAVTDRDVQVFKHRPKGWTLKLGDKVATWDRSAIRVSSEKTQMTTRVTIEWPADGSKIVFDTNKGSIGDDLVAGLSAPVAAPA